MTFILPLKVKMFCFLNYDKDSNIISRVEPYLVSTVESISSVCILSIDEAVVKTMIEISS